MYYKNKKILALLRGAKGETGATGAKGETGATGAKLVSQVLQSVDENGGNIYLQTFDDGTTATFTAPKGESGGAFDYEIVDIETHFRIENNERFAEEGMTWAAWCSSSYNKDGYYINTDGKVCILWNDTVCNINGETGANVITDGKTYILVITSTGTDI